MLSLKLILEKPDYVKERIATKKVNVDIDKLVKLANKRKDLQSKGDELKHIRNEKGKLIPEYKKEGKDVSQIMKEMKDLSQKIKEIDNDIKKLDEEIHNILIWIPNIPHDSVPVGDSEADNKIIKEWGEKPSFDFKPRTHWELGETLDILDLKRGAKITASNFPLFKKAGAKLCRALLNFMLDIHLDKHGYTEIWPPYLVNRNTMFGTGQLPKLEEDMYLCEKDDLFLIPTAEVPVTNIFKNEILPPGSLPIYYTAWTPCFRREAGSYGKDTRGIIRVHQFDKVEMVKFVKPEDSYEELEKLLQNAEEILQILELPYRVVELCTADLSFAAAKCYDIEVYAAGIDKYLEVSSCSNFEDFQARRANIRFKRNVKSKPEFVHTLNGSGLALPRTIIAIMENYQMEDGRIKIPDALVPYMGMKYIE